MAETTEAWSTGEYSESQQPYPIPAPPAPVSTSLPSSTFTITKRGRVAAAVTIALRAPTVLFALIAFSVMASVTFRDNLPGYQFVVTMNVIVFVYALIQLIHTVVVLALGNTYPQPLLALAISSFTFDAVFAFLLIAASAAGTASAVTEFWDSQAAAAVAMSYIVFVFVTLSAILSAHRLFHLFKGSNSSSI
ncbi:hypothetical protein BDL97_08G098900 [Sphagnum fallax]|nr:hypothetical protein BDL97_08G098900 [Sphagnum fallax]